MNTSMFVSSGKYGEMREEEVAKETGCKESYEWLVDSMFLPLLFLLVYVCSHLVPLSSNIVRYSYVCEAVMILCLSWRRETTSRERNEV